MTRKTIDWEALEVHYRAGIRSLKDIGAEFGVSDAAIIKRAKRDNWVRDLKAKIRAAAEAKVSAALVSAEVSTQTKITEKVTVEIEAQVQARIQLTQRKDIGRYRSLAQKMLEELESVTGESFDLEALILAVGQNDPSAAGQIAKITSMGSRIKGLSELSNTLKTLIGLERQAFGIADNAEGDKPLAAQAPASIDDIARKLAFVLGKAARD